LRFFDNFVLLVLEVCFFSSYFITIIENVGR
jgi:hypothetical protein